MKALTINKLIPFRAIASVAIMALGLAASTQAATNEMHGSLSTMDYRFAAKAAKGGMSEVKTAQLAATNAMNPAVKQFAQTMITDHTKANDQLMTIITQKGATLPEDKDSMMAEHEYNHLAKLTGADFDKAYMEHTVREHKMTIKEFERASTHATDPDLKNFATQTLPTLQMHLKMAQDTEMAVKGK